MRLRKGCVIVTAVLAIAGLIVGWWVVSDRSEHAATAAPTRIEDVTPDRNEMSMAELLDLAVDAHANMVATVDDYTARFVKQEQDLQGRLSETTEMLMKIQTAHRGGEPGSPMRVYLKFLSPQSVSGRDLPCHAQCGHQDP